MNMIICPLCGRSTSLRKFNPSWFDSEIYVKTVTGLGRGRGFAVTDREPITEDMDHEAVQLIKDRILILADSLHNAGSLSLKEISQALPYIQVNQDGLSSRDQVIKDLTGEMVTLKEELSGCDKLVYEKDEIIEDLTNKSISSRGEINQLQRLIKDKDSVEKSLSEENIKLKSEISDLESTLEHKASQISELCDYVEERGETIKDLKAQIRDLSEELINDE